MIRREEVGYFPTKRSRERDRFTEAEVETLRMAAAEDPVDHGMLLFLLHTGCRSGALCHLLVDDVRDPSTGCMRSTGSVDEKGGVRQTDRDHVVTTVWLREFTIDPILAEALCGAIARNKGSIYVFPASRGGVRKRQMSMNDTWLRRLCARCKPPIVGSHVHVHALRRTVISMLLDWAL